MVTYEIEVSHCKRTVWVHASDGSTVGRFGKFGVDIHNTVTEQLNGAPECRLCTHGQVTIVEWNLFIDKSKEYWGVTIDPESISDTLFSRQ